MEFELFDVLTFYLLQCRILPHVLSRLDAAHDGLTWHAGVGLHEPFALLLITSRLLPRSVSFYLHQAALLSNPARRKQTRPLQDGIAAASVRCSANALGRNGGNSNKRFRRRQLNAQHRRCRRSSHTTRKTRRHPSTFGKAINTSRPATPVKRGQ